jgi:hypothetical protein
MNHITTYTFGQIVYLKTDPEQLPRMVISIRLLVTGNMYELGQGPTSSDHYEIEISQLPDLNLKMGIEGSHQVR